MTRPDLLQALIDGAEGWNEVAAFREPGGGIVLLLSHRATLDDALLVYVPTADNVAELDSEVGNRTNKNGPWREET